MARNDIQMLRLTISRAATAKISTVAHKEVLPLNALPRRQAQLSQHGQNNQQEVLKGGPPCPAFNPNKGCTLNSGHVINGKKMVHVCSFCLFNTSAANTHSESQYRNKIRFGTASGHFQ